MLVDSVQREDVREVKRETRDSEYRPLRYRCVRVVDNCDAAQSEAMNVPRVILAIILVYCVTSIFSS